ncbi:hypothetical protein BC629DRAFT_572459 [Irpex lacteus]|nr:hypothetical protein BC629DRAFT_572459 [Irpex lacteus]
MPSLNETSTQIFTEKTYLQGGLLCGVAYGAGLPLYVLALWCIRNRRSCTTATRTAFLLFICVLFIMASITYASVSQLTQLAFVDNRDFEGGPSAYEKAQETITLPVSMMGNACFVAIIWFCDGLLVWRFYVIYHGLRVPALASVALPILMWLATIVAGSMFLLHVSGLTVPVNDGSIKWTTVFLTVSLSLNILLTLAISLRLLLLRRYLISNVGKGHGLQYANLVAITIESAAIFSAFSILVLVPFAMHNPVNNIFIQSLPHVQIIATLLIIVRVAQGKSWNTETACEDIISTIRFERDVQTVVCSTTGEVEPECNDEDTTSVGSLDQ